MNRALTWTGYAAAGAVVFALAADFAAHASTRSEPIVPAPAGFRQVLRGIGPVELGFVGRTVFVTDKREEAAAPGAAARVPAWRVEGDDPRPEGNGAAIAHTRIIAPRSERGEPLTVEAPRAWVPLARAEGDLRLDMNREWRMTDPVLVLPGFAPGRSLTAAATGEAWLDPRKEAVRSPGRFVIEADDLKLVAAQFHYDAAAGVIRFAPWRGEVSWSLRDASGRTFRGTCDGPGEAAPTADGGIELRLQGGALGVRAALPGGPGAPASQVLGQALTVIAAPAGVDGWLPRSAHVTGPVFLTDARLAFEGGAADLEWNEAGELRGLTVAGPASVRPWDASFAVATARGSARFDPATGLLRLDGRSLVVDPRGQVAADAAAWDGSQLRASGEVVALAAQGLARADALAAAPDGGLSARGDVRIFPADAPAEEVRAPAMTLDRAGLMRMDEGFRASGFRKGEAWSAEGGRALSRLLDDGQRRTDGSGGIVYRAPGLVVRADTMEQLDARRFRLDGAPATATMDLQGGGQAVARFRRAIHDDESLHIEGAPHLTVPAAAVGLSGADVELDARTVTRDHATGEWVFENDVRVAGALEAQADRVTWSPTVGMRLERRGRAPSAAGTLADGRAFSATAAEIAVDAAGALLLDGDAVARLVELDGRTHVLTAEREQLAATGGFAEGRARFDSPMGRASGLRADWRSADSRIVWLKITGEAALAVDKARAEGAEIEMDEASGWMSVTGDAARAAHIVLEDGREVRADWLRYNVRSKLLESGPTRFEAPGGGQKPNAPK